MAMAVATVVGAGTTAHASSLTINPTFSSSLTSGQQSAIDAAITMIESDITSPNNINVSIYFGSMNSGLGQTNSATFDIPYYDYYLAFSALATSPAQQTALASLGPAPTGLGSGNPVNGNAIEITSAEARNLGLSGDAGYMSAPGGSGSYDGVVLLNTSMAVTPNSLSDNNYSLEAVANHEIDEVLGIGGSGSTLANGNTGPVGDLDLYRYSAPGVRSYSATSPLAYFSINGGNTVLSYFNQTAGADYGDWLSNPIPTGYEPQLQDAFGTPGANPTLGPNELAAFSAIGYQIEIAPEPSTFALVGLGLLGFGILRRRQSAKS